MALLDLDLAALKEGYVSPFVTCAWCNTLNFIDADVYREAQLGRPTGRRIGLPPCTGCGQALRFAAGATDLEARVEADRQARIAQRRKRRTAAVTLQRLWRGRVARKEMELRRKILEMIRIRRNQAATDIQAVGRGMIAKKMALVERSLLRIKVWPACAATQVTSHVLGEQKAVRSVLMEALRMRVSTDGKKRHVFWYKRKPEQDLVFRDYRLFVERTGNQPPLHVVEANIIELARRIDRIETGKVIMIQRLFRGVLSRMFVKEYAVERARLASMRHTAGIMLQRWWRGVSAVRLAEMLRDKLHHDGLLERYLEERHEQHVKEDDAVVAAKAKAYYSQAIKQSATALVTGKLAYGASNGHILYAFSKSAYRSDTKTASALIRDTLRRRQQKLEAIDASYREAAKHNAYVDSRESQNKGFVQAKYFARLPEVPPPMKLPPIPDVDRLRPYSSLSATR